MVPFLVIKYVNILDYVNQNTYNRHHLAACRVQLFHFYQKKHATPQFDGVALIRIANRTQYIQIKIILIAILFWDSHFLLMAFHLISRGRLLSFS